MSLKDFKIEINSRLVFLFLLIIIFIGLNISTVSAATIDIASGLQNSDIQTLIDGSQQGDTINFIGNSYENISLIINKKLNIISTKNSLIVSNNSNGIQGSSMGITSTFAFYFSNNSSGSVISGFNILSNSDYGIVAENVKNIFIGLNNISAGNKGSIELNNVSNFTINKNNLSNSNGNGLNIENSNTVSVNGNQMKNNTYSGIRVANSSDIKITSNNVVNNNLSGTSIYSSKNVSIKNNTLENNGHGVYLSNTHNVNVTGNEINKNRLNGITLEDKTENTYISYNNITKNLNGIYVDSYSVNDTIISNNIKNSIQSVYTYLNVFETGNGIGVGDNYQKSDTLINIKYNIITDNQHFSIKTNPQYDHFAVGANWFGTNDPANTGTCPMVSTCMIMARLVKTTNGYELRFYDGNTLVTTLPSFNAVFQLNGENSQSVPVVNGKASYKYNMDTSKENIISAIVGKYMLNLNIPAYSDNSATDINNPNVLTTNNENSGYTSGNGQGSGNQNVNGSFNGNGNGQTLIGITGSSLSQIGGEKSNGGKAVEVSIKNAINSVKDNPYTILGILVLLGLIAVGYFKRDNFR
ncbi:MAG: right-handed parallel beta-helix repeat-containing protein [Methanobacterium sp.]